MRVNEHCAACLWDKQRHRSDHPGFLCEVREIIDHRKEGDTAPYLVYLFNLAYERYFGKADPYKEIKRAYNDFVLAREDGIREKIKNAPDPLAASLAYARIGNYIDFGAMTRIDDDTFLALLDGAALTGRDLPTYQAFLQKCGCASCFLLIADNCGELVLDRLFLEQLHARFPSMNFSVMVRGSDVLNDATEEDARYVGLDRIAGIVSNGTSVAGTIYDMLPDAARRALDCADVILAKGQGNYESLSGQGRSIFYSFLCKCDLFTERFQVPKLTGIFIQRD